MRIRHIAAMGGIFTLMTSVASACSVPVFRYALERWQASSYPLAVLHQGALTQEQRALCTSLDPEGRYALAIEYYDAAGDLPEGLKAMLDDSAANHVLHGMLMLPADMGAQNSVVWQGALDAAGIAELKKSIYSPLMRRMCEALASGDVAVWIFDGGADTNENQRVRTLLETSLERMRQELKLPHELDPEDTAYSRPLAIGVPLTKTFSIVDADLDAPGNALLKRVLALLDPKRMHQPGPAVLPVFGRGRALAVLKGESLTDSVFQEVGVFLTGACSCRVKDLNPGFDLLAPFPWDDVLFGRKTIEEALSGLPAAPAQPREPAVAGPPGTNPEQNEDRP